MRCYVDTSAAGKLVKSEAESAALVEWLTSTDVELVSSQLLETELRRLAQRDGFSQEDAAAVLDLVALQDADGALFRAAGLLPGPALRSLDAIHLATAIRVEADAVLTYDERLAMSTAWLGLDVIAPGA